MIIDGHAHIFSPKIIANVSAKTELVKILDLQTSRAQGRDNISLLMEECQSSGVDACLILPTAEAADIVKINRYFVGMAAALDMLFTAGTLHPYCDANDKEIMWLQSRGVRAIKLCSFSQGFPLFAPETFTLFRRIEEVNKTGKGHFFVILDTFYRAHEYFGTPNRHTTTPFLLGEIIRRFQEIDFVAAHMGGLAAPPEEIFTHLRPSRNLYLDTSNAAHTLSQSDFLRLLDLHGPEHILFGTDWPWFGHNKELEIIESLLNLAGFDRGEKESVFGHNIARLQGIDVTAWRGP